MLTQQLSRLLLLIYYSFVVVGAPIQLPSSGGAASETATDQQTSARFPCEGGSCGCTVEHCWSSCCCRDQQQRLDWARTNGVTPPSTALQAARTAGLDVSEWFNDDGSSESGSTTETCCDQGRDEGTGGDCGSVDSCCDRPHTDTPSDNSIDSELNLGTSILVAMSCRGLDIVWLTVTAAPLGNSLAIADDAQSEALTVSRFIFVEPDPYSPPTPPPRGRF